MNRRATGLTISKAIPGFINYKSAEGLSPNTLYSYERDLNLWLTYQEDIDISKVTSRDIRDYLNYLRIEYKPRRITGNNDKKLSPKTIRNVWVTLASFFKWASIEFEITNPIKQVPAPKITIAPVEPFSKEDIEILLKACDYCEEAQTINRLEEMRDVLDDLANDMSQAVPENTWTELHIYLIEALECEVRDCFVNS